MAHYLVHLIAPYIGWLNESTCAATYKNSFFCQKYKLKNSASNAVEGSSKVSHGFQLHTADILIRLLFGHIQIQNETIVWALEGKGEGGSLIKTIDVPE